jgi:hypothetical protein
MVVAPWRFVSVRPLEHVDFMAPVRGVAAAVAAGRPPGDNVGGWLGATVDNGATKASSASSAGGWRLQQHLSGEK